MAILDESAEKMNEPTIVRKNGAAMPGIFQNANDGALAGQ